MKEIRRRGGTAEFRDFSSLRAVRELAAEVHKLRMLRDTNRILGARETKAER